MSADLLKSWKQHRFIIPLPDLYPRVVVLTDIGYWTENYDELRAWAQIRDCEVEGMAVEFFDQRTLTEFILRWT